MCLAVPGKITSINSDDPYARMAKVSFGGILKEVSLAFLPEAKVGDYVIVHVGTGLSILDEEEAAHVFSLLEQLDQAAEDEGSDEVCG
ncbi:MAG TPA: HypC/HybG/HupF family hydrogenase formation chaperone [Armatimonadota bacterium]|jgi:hydrogenase expression/formation protein HypC